MVGYRSLMKFARRLLPGAAAVSLAGCATAAPDAAQVAGGGKPALWKLADADTTIYLFGTIHLLPEGVDWRTPALDRAMAAADTLVLETTISGDMMATAQTMAKLGVSPGLPPILERVPADKRAALAEAIKASGVPAKAFDRLETWAAAMTLMALQLQQMGYNPELGVEKGLEAAKGSKQVVGLETVEQQLGFFDQLSEPAQRAFLASAADDPEAAKAQFEAMLKAWSSGDVEGIARTFDSETTLSPELREVLIKRRNAAWAEWLQKRLDQPGTVMVAVGAGHLAGTDSVQRMLAARGLKAERVQ